MAQRWQGQAPRDGILHPVWEPTRRGEPDAQAWVARCVLGSGWLAGGRRLSMLDLRVWAALCAQLREQLPEAPASDPSLADADTRTVQTTGYQLADAVWSDDGGERYGALRASLRRLQGTTITVRTVEADSELAAVEVVEGWVVLLGDVWTATTRLDLTTPRQWGELKGSSSLRVEVGRWPAQQVVAGRCTWLDLDLLRSLGSGLAARLWAALEAWGRWPQRSIDAREETTAIGLGEPARQSLGVGGYREHRQARAALNRAGQVIVARDAAYRLVCCERRGGGWALVVRRLSGGRARAQARSEASWRSPGTAAARRQRPERAAIRARIRDSLADGAS